MRAFLAGLIVLLACPAAASAAVANGRIAYGSWSYVGVVTMAPDGTDVRAMPLPDGRPAGCPAFSPDGTRLAVCTDGADAPRLSVTGLDGNVLGRIDAPHQHSVQGPDWSPDASRIAFTTDMYWDIFTARPDGTDVRQLTHTGNVQEWDPAWSPDGTRIAYAGQDGYKGDFDLFTMAPDGTDVRG